MYNNPLLLKFFIDCYVLYELTQMVGFDGLHKKLQVLDQGCGQGAPWHFVFK